MIWGRELVVGIVIGLVLFWLYMNFVAGRKIAGMNAPAPSITSGPGY